MSHAERATEANERPVVSPAFIEITRIREGQRALGCALLLAAEAAFAAALDIHAMHITADALVAVREAGQ